MSKLRKMIVIFCSIGFLGCLFLLGQYTQEMRHAQEVIDRTSKEGLLQSLRQRQHLVENKESSQEKMGYPDSIGWINIPGTDIDYPVMQREGSPEYYLYRDVEGNASRSGVPFLEANCDATNLENNLIIYGHHMRNGMMFSGLKKYEDPSYGRNHPSIMLDLATGNKTYELFAVLQSSGDGDIYGLRENIQIEGVTAYDSFIKELQEAAHYTLSFPTGEYPPLLFLVTCSTTTRTSGRIIIAAYEKERNIF